MAEMNGNVIRIPLRIGIILAPLAVAAVLAWAWVKEAPKKYEKLSEKVASHDTKITLLEVKLEYIQEGITDIKTMIRNGRRRQPARDSK